MSARALVERYATSRAGSDLNPLGEVLGVPLGSARRPDDVDDVALDRFGDVDLVDLVARRKDGVERLAKDLARG